MSDANLILAGGGLANTLIALRLVETHPGLKVLLLEQEQQPGGNHTWSFHGGDLTAAQRAWLAPLIEYNWSSYSVRFPNFERTLPGTYHSLTSERLAEIARERLGDAVCTGVTVSELRPDSVRLDDGTILTAQAVIDGRGPSPSRYLDVRFQKFVGRIVRLTRPHNLAGPVIMDATPPQEDGYRFLYTLPFTADTVLIEDTRYSDGPGLAADDYGNEIAKYAASQSWEIAELLREEDGVLPITLGGDIKAFWDDGPPVARSGLHAALFHPATGYSLPNAVRLAESLASLPTLDAATLYRHTRRQSERLWRSSTFYRTLNRMLFLAAAPGDRRAVLERFYGLNESLIARFYAGSNTWADKLRILAGKPPVKISKAFDAVFRYQPPENM
jgi:lycopene beta-cyclase